MKRNGMVGVQTWLAEGTLLADGLCIGEKYERDVVPVKGKTTVYSTVAEPKIRDINLSEGTISVDFQLTMRWLDPNIKTRFDTEDEETGFIVLSKASISKIWTPDLYIHDSRSFKMHDEWMSLQRSSAVTTHMPGISMANHAIIEVEYQIKSTVYCHFYTAAYPMDLQTCNLTFRSGSFEAIFALYDLDKSSRDPIASKSSSFEFQIHLLNNMKRDVKSKIGMKIVIQRILSPFLLKYYVPCIGIVLLSAMSFAIPVSAIPGRVGLLVTLFLTLTNLFIHQMVSLCANSYLLVLIKYS